MRKFLALSGALALAACNLAGCTTAQLTSTFSAISTGCAVATATEAAAPSLASHNVKVVNGITYVCTDAPAAEALAAAAAAQGQSVTQ